MKQEQKEKEVESLLDAFPSSLEARVEAVERRHLFWRARCMDHARKIDEQFGELRDLRAVLVDFIKADEPMEKLRQKAIDAVYGSFE